MNRIFIISALAVFYIPFSAYSTIINIPADYPTIQQGINASINGDTVLVQPGTYGRINFNGRNIVLGSLFLTTGDTSYISQTIIDGDSVESVIVFESGEDSTAIISGFLIQNGNSYFGGGVSCDSSSPLIIYNYVMENYALYGGGINCNNNSNPRIINNLIINNNAHFDRGGGVYCHYSDPSIINNIIENNMADYGGGIMCWNSDAIIEGNLIVGNSSVMHGGGIGCHYSNPSIRFNLISENSCLFGAGGINLDYSAPLIFNNLIFRNSTTERGGGIHCFESNPLISNNTISRNIAGMAGGGIRCSFSSPLIINSIFWADSVGSISQEISGSPQITYSNIQGGWPGEGNIDIDPLFRDPAGGDFHLMSVACGDSADSPCIDAGDPNIIDSLLDCSWGLGGARSDMGAYGGGDSVTVRIFDNIPSLPDRFMLLQNYPNPFNARTTFRFVLPKSQNVKLTIYDLLGRQVETLLDEYKLAGVHAVAFDASHLSNGVYFYRLRAGETVETKRMVLLK
jgi:hypothetical protein